MKKTPEQVAEEWVTQKMTWDDYEAEWIESGIKTFLAGRKHFIEHELRDLLKKAMFKAIECERGLEGIEDDVYDDELKKMMDNII